jgi:hypothetical protein
VLEPEQPVKRGTARGTVRGQRRRADRGKGRRERRSISNSDFDDFCPELESRVAVDQSRHHHREAQEGEHVLWPRWSTDDESDRGTEEHGDVQTLAAGEGDRWRGGEGGGYQEEVQSTDHERHEDDGRVAPVGDVDGDEDAGHLRE